MSPHKLKAKSGILYVRASLGSFAKEIRSAGGVAEFLLSYFEFEELFAPYFRRARPFWERRSSEKPSTNSGALGKRLAKNKNAIISDHPSHSFVGYGKNVVSRLQEHDFHSSCFAPISQLAEDVDFSMLLLSCCDSSPGFSTVHASQSTLGLSQRHLFRYLVRWDIENNGKTKSIIPNESPGCSSSFDKFYSAYESDGNLKRGKILGQDFLFVHSAASAINVEKQILSDNPRYVKCGKLFCSTCSFRLY